MFRSLLFFGVLLVGCSTDSNQSQELKFNDAREAKNKSNQDWSNIEVDREKVEITPSDESLFGKFFHDRIAFHIIDDPKIQLHHAKVNKITLYYIDSILCKKKYELDRSIADELALEYGKLSYKSLNLATDSLVQSMGIVISSEKGNRLNPYLKKYQLKWKLDDKAIYFRHLEDSLSTSNYYIEELKEYQQLFNSVQRELI